MTDTPDPRRALRDAFGTFMTGVTVVTTNTEDGSPRGYTANSFTSVSLDPPLLLVCANKAPASIDIYRQAKGFAVNILAEHQKDVSVLFASKRPDKFEACNWRPGPYGSPIIDGSAAVQFPEELEKDPAADVKAALKGQRDVFASRNRSLEGELRIVRESTKGLHAQLASLAQLKSGREKQVSLFNAQLGKFQALQQQGFVSQNQLLDIERQLSEVQSKQAEDLSNIAATNARLAEFQMRDQKILNDYRKEVEAQLTEAQKELSLQTERMKGLSDSFDRLVIKAPVAGTVVDVAVNTVGGVVKPGDRVMDIVPADEALVVEAHLAPQFIDRVRPGLPADVGFDAYVSMAKRPRVAWGGGDGLS